MIDGLLATDQSSNRQRTSKFRVARHALKAPTLGKVTSGRVPDWSYTSHTPTASAKPFRTVTWKSRSGVPKSLHSPDRQLERRANATACLL